MGTLAAQNPDDGLDGIERQLLVEYQILQTIADHEVQSVYLTFAVFIPLLATAAASLFAVLISGKLAHIGPFLTLGVIGTIATLVLILAWWKVTNRRQAVRQRMFTRQSEIAKRLGGHMLKQYIFEYDFQPKPLIPGPLWLERLILPCIEERRRDLGRPDSSRRAEATFTNLMRLTVGFPLFLWVMTLMLGILELAK